MSTKYAFDIFHDDASRRGEKNDIATTQNKIEGIHRVGFGETLLGGNAESVDDDGNPINGANYNPLFLLLLLRSFLSFFLFHSHGNSRGAGN